MKDLEYEHTVGKISDDDFQRLDAAYRVRAKEVLSLLDRDFAPYRSRAEALIAEAASGVKVEAKAEAKAEAKTDDEAFASSCEGAAWRAERLEKQLRRRSLRRSPRQRQRRRPRQRPNPTPR